VATAHDPRLNGHDSEISLDASPQAERCTFDPGSHHLGTWTGFAVFCGYTAVAVTAAAIVLVRRDA
jgi:hypothetical protein